MKKLLILMVFSVGVCNAQYDFDNRYFTITADVEVFEEPLAVSSFQNKVNNTIYKKATFADFTNQEVTSQNFWQPVDFASATEVNNRTKSSVNIDMLNAAFGNSQLNGYTTDGATTVKNSVYKDVRGLSFYGECPPFGICGRCAPYRVGRGF